MSGSILVEFANAASLAVTLRRLRDEGYSAVEVYEPYADDAIDRLLPGRSSPVRWFVLAGGAAGGAGAYVLQWYAARDYPLNVGGRPLHSWPSFVPVTFELTVLAAALTGLLALLWFTGLPRLDHPLFRDPRFLRASEDRFFLRISTRDPRYSAVGLGRILRDADALSITEVGE